MLLAYYIIMLMHMQLCLERRRDSINPSDYLR